MVRYVMFTVRLYILSIVYIWRRKERCYLFIRAVKEWMSTQCSSSSVFALDPSSSFNHSFVRDTCTSKSIPSMAIKIISRRTTKQALKTRPTPETGKARCLTSRFLTQPIQDLLAEHEHALPSDDVGLPGSTGANGVAFIPSCRTWAG